MYYNIKLIYDLEDGTCWIEENVKVNSRQEAEEIVPQMVKNEEITGEYKVELTETTIDEMIEKEEKSILLGVRRKYISSSYDMDSLTVRQWAKISRELDEDKEKYYKALTEYDRYDSICRLVKKKADMSKMTVAEYDQIVLELYRAKTKEECEKIFREKVSQ
ncbi:MAG: hypothetical protein J6Q55_02790 [Clostridia bacterium]|nr:hypothetical protein [Clostridia bacterium]